MNHLELAKKLAGLTEAERKALLEQAESIAEERAEAERARNTWPKRVEFYVNSDKDYNYELADRLGLSVEGIDNFRHTGYELKLLIEVDEKGMAHAVEFCGVELPKKVAL